MPYFIHRSPQNVYVDQSPEAPDSLWHLGPLDSKIDAKDLASLIAGYYATKTADKPLISPVEIAREIFARLNGVIPDDKREIDAEICRRTGCSQATARKTFFRVINPSPKPWGGHRENAGRKANT